MTPLDFGNRRLGLYQTIEVDVHTFSNRSRVQGCSQLYFRLRRVCKVRSVDRRGNARITPTGKKVAKGCAAWLGRKEKRERERKRKKGPTRISSKTNGVFQRLPGKIKCVVNTLTLYLEYPVVLYRRASHDRIFSSARQVSTGIRFGRHKR